MLINCLRGMKRKAHGAQEPGNVWKYAEVTSTAQRGDSPAQVINQRFLSDIERFIIFSHKRSLRHCAAEQHYELRRR